MSFDGTHYDGRVGSLSFSTFRRRDKMKTSKFVGAALLWLSSCAYQKYPDLYGEESRCIKGGTPIAARESVVAVGCFEESGQIHLCSGIHIAPGVVATAAHCIDYPSYACRVYWGPKVNVGTSSSVIATRWEMHPGHEKDHPKYDVGKVFTDTIPQVPIANIDLDPIHPGDKVELVGYGIDELGSGDFGTKRAGKDSISTVLFGAFTTSSTGATGLPGDSGGPAMRAGAALGILSMLTDSGANVYERISAHLAFLGLDGTPPKCE